MKKLAISKKGPLFLKALSSLSSEKREAIKSRCKQISSLILKKYYDVYSVSQIYQSCYNTIGCLSIGLIKMCGKYDEIQSEKILCISPVEDIFKIGFNEILKISSCKTDISISFLDNTIAFKTQAAITKVQQEIFTMELFSGEPEKFWDSKIFDEQIAACEKYFFYKWFFKKFFEVDKFASLPDDLQVRPMLLYESSFKSALMNLIIPNQYKFNCIMGEKINRKIIIHNREEWKKKVEELSADIPDMYKSQYDKQCNHIYKMFISRSKLPRSILYEYDINRSMKINHDLKMQKEAIVDHKPVARRTWDAKKRSFKHS